MSSDLESSVLESSQRRGGVCALEASSSENGEADECEDGEHIVVRASLLAKLTEPTVHISLVGSVYDEALLCPMVRRHLGFHHRGKVWAMLALNMVLQCAVCVFLFKQVDKSEKLRPVLHDVCVQVDAGLRAAFQVENFRENLWSCTPHEVLLAQNFATLDLNKDGQWSYDEAQELSERHRRLGRKADMTIVYKKLYTALHSLSRTSTLCDNGDKVGVLYRGVRYEGVLDGFPGGISHKPVKLLWHQGEDASSLGTVRIPATDIRQEVKGEWIPCAFRPCRDNPQGEHVRIVSKCDIVSQYPDMCTKFDRADFNASKFCCACGGGDNSIINYGTRSIQFANSDLFVAHNASCWDWGCDSLADGLDNLTCQCDPGCLERGNCCGDYNSTCKASKTSPLGELPGLSLGECIHSHGEEKVDECLKWSRISKGFYEKEVQPFMGQCMIVAKTMCNDMELRKAWAESSPEALQRRMHQLSPNFVPFFIKLAKIQGPDELFPWRNVCAKIVSTVCPQIFTGKLEVFHARRNDICGSEVHKVTDDGILLTRFKHDETLNNANTGLTSHWRLVILMFPLSLWSLSILIEMRSLLEWWGVLLFIPFTEDMCTGHDEPVIVTDTTIEVCSIPRRHWQVTMALNLVPRTLLAIFILYAGVQYLLVIPSAETVILNSLKMAFLMQIDDMLFRAFASQKHMNWVKACRPIEANLPSRAFGFELPCVTDRVPLAFVCCVPLTIMLIVNVIDSRRVHRWEASAMRCLCDVAGEACLAAHLLGGSLQSPGA